MGLGIRTISLSVLFSIVGIGVLTTVHVGRGSGMVHVPVSVGSSNRYIGVRVPIVRRDMSGIGWGIRTISLSVLFSVVGIGVLTTVDVGGSSGMVHVPVSMGSRYRCVRIRVAISGRVIGVRCVSRVVGVGGCVVGVG